MTPAIISPRRAVEVLLYVPCVYRKCGFLIQPSADGEGEVH